MGTLLSFFRKRGRIGGMTKELFITYINDVRVPEEWRGPYIVLVYKGNVKNNE